MSEKIINATRSSTTFIDEDGQELIRRNPYYGYGIPEDIGRKAIADELIKIDAISLNDVLMNTKIQEELGYVREALDLAFGFNRREITETLNEIIKTALHRGWMNGIKADQLVTNVLSEMDYIEPEYSFEENKGISGILFQNSLFKACGNAEHHMLTGDMTFEEKSQLVYFSSICNFHENSGTITVSPIGFNGVSEDQIKWLDENEKHLDKMQVFMYNVLKKTKKLYGVERER